MVSGSVHILLFGDTSGPGNIRYKNLQDVYPVVRNDVTEPLSKANIKKLNIPPETIAFLKQKLMCDNIKGNYRELIELTLMVLGEENFRLRDCGAYSNARWMSRLIYEFKYFLLRNSLTLLMTDAEPLCIERFVMFSVSVHVMKWLQSPSIFVAAENYLAYYKQICMYSVSLYLFLGKLILKRNHYHFFQLFQQVTETS